MKVQIYSRREIETIIADGEYPENTAVVSFCDSGTRPRERVNYSSICSRIMYIELDDLELDELSEKGYSFDTFFPESNEVAEFIIDAYYDGMNIICQCEYGHSYSAGCAAAILEHLYHKGIEIFADHRYYPNKLVYHNIFNALKQNYGDFEIDEDGKLTKYNGISENVVIPDCVKMISFRAFENSKIKSVKIPESVYFIEDCAFDNCKNLERINIPVSVTEIGTCAFQLCKNLEFIEISPDVYIDRNVFYGTKWARDYPDDFIIVNGVLIGYKGGQSKVIIPDNVLEIGVDAFAFLKKVKEVVIPKTVEKIGFNAFGSCENLELITIENPDMEIEDWGFVDCPNVKRIICCGRSVLIKRTKDNDDDFTDTVSNIMAFVRQKNEHK